ncbi:MAG: hypothetical protein FJ298_01600 [Planctomycetes bacterium]|nr:hypothetical protein [Planctomycetota bacterium]
MSARVATALRWTGFAAALAALASAALLAHFERSGGLRDEVRRALARELGLELDIERAELDWFGPGLTLHGVTLSGAAQACSLRQVELALEFAAGGLRPARIDVRGGRLELSSELLARWEAALERRTRADGASASEAVHVPVLVVEGVRCDWLHPDWGRLALGDVDLLFRAAADGVPRIEGRIQPAFADAQAARDAQVFLSGERDAQGRIRLAASCEAVPVDSSAIPAASPAGPVRAWKPSARLSIELEARFALEESAPSSGRLRLRVVDGSLALPTSPVPLVDVRGDVEALCASPNLAGLLEPASWRSTAHVAARWDGHEASLWAQFGANAGAQHSARAWLHAPSVPLTRELARATGHGDELEELWRITDPIGTVDVLVGARWPRASSAALTTAALRPELVADVDLGGTVSLCYAGVADSAGVREGFPMRVERAQGRLLALHDAALARPSRLGIVGVLGAHSLGTRDDQPAFADGLVQFDLASDAPAWLDLRVGGRRIPVGQELEQGLRGLSGTDFIFPSFSPSGGLASVVTRLHMQGAAAPSCQLVVEVEDVSARWDGLPLPLVEVSGRIEFAWDPRRLAATTLDLAARSLQGAEVLVRGRLQDLPSPADAPRSLEVIEVDARGIGLRGSDRTALAQELPEVESVLGSLHATGHADARFRMAGSGAYGGRRTWRAEVEPRADSEVQPDAFRVRVSDLRGRVLLEGELALGETSGAAARQGAHGHVAPLVGRWVAGGTLAAMADIPPSGDSTIAIDAAALDLSHPALGGALAEARSSGVGGFAGPGLASLNVTGRVDFHGDFVLPQAAPRALESLYRVHLRENDVRTAAELGRLDFTALVGTLEQSGAGDLYGAELRAELAGTPLLLRDTRFGSRADRFRFETSLEALELPIDREHLAPLFDEALVASLLDDLHWRGELDIRGARLELETGADGVGEAVLRGSIEPRAMAIDLGLPIEIDTALVTIEEFRFGPAGARLQASVSNLHGQVSDREIERGSLRLAYADGRLEVIGLTARLENGRVDSLPAAAGERPFFAVELAEPYRFELAGALSDVELEGLLRGMFESDFASRGTLDARLELSGDLERVSGIHGSGKLEIDDSVLWSIPLVRDLLASLKVETGSVFERIESDLALSEGALRLRNLRIESPLLSLDGDGTLDLDGGLDFDLDVQYRMLDWLGVVNRVIYWVQSGLVRVAIRGDMARPRVEVGGALGRATDKRRGPRDLPLPPLAPLPARF